MVPDSGLPWMEGPGESSNRESIINARLAAAMNTRLEDGVPPQPMQNVVEQVTFYIIPSTSYFII